MLTPSELVARAHGVGVRALAVTDHDVTDGVAEARTAAGGVGIQLIPGVEISVTWQRQTVHVLGLCIDPGYEPLQSGLARLREFRNWRAQEIGRRLQKKNILGAYDHARTLAHGAVVSRTHFARFLLSQGYVPTMAQAFKQYLARGRCAYVPGQWASLDAAVGWIRGTGGIAVVAHPARYQLTTGKLRRLLQEFKECGGTAIEVASGRQPVAELEHLARLAVEFELLGSVGSDFHGPEQTWLELGRLSPLAPAVTPVWTAFPPEFARPVGRA